MPQREIWIGQGYTGNSTPRKRPSLIKINSKLRSIALKELYHNPVPLYRLIGEPNETSIIVENQKITGLIDSGTQISSISDKFAKELELEGNWKHF